MFDNNAFLPTAVLLSAVVLYNNAPTPTATGGGTRNPGGMSMGGGY